MAERIVMPKLGLTMETGLVSSWLKKEGETVVKGENLFEIETDKIVNVVESPCTGTLLKILVGEGIEVKVLTLLAVVGAPGEDISGIISQGDSPQDEAVTTRQVQQETPVSSASSRSKAEVNITPRARKLMAKHGLDASEFAGFDKKRVTEDDVMKLLEQKGIEGQ